MPLDNWGTPLRDVLTDAEVAVSPNDLNEKFLAFYRADGEAYAQPYANINAHLAEPLSGNRIETWKKLFDTVGLLYVDDGRVRVSKFGHLLGGQWERLNDHAAEARKTLALSAVGVLGRYQLLNPTTRNRGYPVDCDIFPYRAIWAAMLRLGDLHWEELHRVLLRVMRTEELEPALAKIEAVRSDPTYNPQDPASATLHLGSAIYADPAQATRRMTPWFSVAGFGGLLIDREAKGGRRSLNAEFRPLVEEELSIARPWLEFETDEEAWFAHLDAGVKGITGMPPQTPSVLDDNDPIFRAVVELVVNDRMGGALLLGAPGTGKSWYARQIALKLTGGDSSRVREVQFHPSYQYEDFVEGYVPDPTGGFELVDKHLLKMADLAKGVDGPVVLVIDEFSRTDPARVFGETMTYMEGSLRGVPFYLPSGRTTAIPKNLLFIATMNPDDRSVDEIDAAMDRRWAKIMLQPEPERVRDFMVANDAPEALRGPVLELFIRLQDHVEVGHAFFRGVKDADSVRRLWETQLKFLVRKRFRFDPDTLKDVEALWASCAEGLLAIENAATDELAIAEVGAPAAGSEQPPATVVGAQVQTEAAEATNPEAT